MVHEPERELEKGNLLGSSCNSSDVAETTSYPQYSLFFFPPLMLEHII